MSEIEQFLNKKKGLNTDNFISEAIDCGFRISKKPEQHKYTETELKGMTNENRKRIEENTKNMPNFVLVNPQNNTVIEIYANDKTITQANAVFKFSFEADKFEVVNDIDKLTRGLGINKFKNGRIVRTESVMLQNEGDLINLNNTINNSQIKSEKLSLDKEELSLFTFMTNHKENDIQMQFKLNQLLGKFNEDIIDYKTHYSKSRKLS